MNYQEFCNLIGPANRDGTFLNYFVQCLDKMSAEYVSKYHRIPMDDRAFGAIGVENAVIAYRWPAAFNLPAPEPHGEPAKTVLLGWSETESALNRLSSQLQTAIDCNNNLRVLEHVEAILDWGMGQRGVAAKEFMKQMPDRAGYLAAVRVAASLYGNTENITANLVGMCNAGLAKIHSLASITGLIIYDSRVAFTIGEIVNQWLLNQPVLANESQIPEHLKFMQAGRRDLHGKVRRPRGNFRHPVERRNYTWLQTQIRASWLFKAGLEASPDLWSGLRPRQRMHRLEAAFFMFGAYAGVLQLP